MLIKTAPAQWSLIKEPYTEITFVEFLIYIGIINYLLAIFLPCKKLGTLFFYNYEYQKKGHQFGNFSILPKWHFWTHAWNSIRKLAAEDFLKVDKIQARNTNICVYILADVCIILHWRTTQYVPLHIHICTSTFSDIAPPL